MTSHLGFMASNFQDHDGLKLRTKIGSSFLGLLLMDILSPWMRRLDPYHTCSMSHSGPCSFFKGVIDWLIAFIMLNFSLTYTKQALYYWATSQPFSFNVLFGNCYPKFIQDGSKLILYPSRTWTYNLPVLTSWVANNPVPPSPAWTFKEPWVHKDSIKLLTIKKQKLWGYAYNVSINLA